jgi:diguanylate cyclase (GGDEF)-like protein
MSFRTRLTLFFVLIVIVPMVSVAVVVFRLISDNETGKADARLAEGQAAARGIYLEMRDGAAPQARIVGSDAELGRALQDRDFAAANARAGELLRELDLTRIVVVDRSRRVVDVGSRSAVSPIGRKLIGSNGRRVGTLQVSETTAARYVERVKRVTTLDVLVRNQRDRTLGATGPRLEGEDLPAVGTVESDDDEYRVASFEAPAVGGGRDHIAVLDSTDSVSSAVGSNRVLAGVVLVGFLVLAFAFALAVSRSLQAQIGRFLEAARRLGGGDFSVEVPTEGHDEFAALGEEFNKMSRQLEARLEELRQERARLESSIRRIGETFASNLDREGLLEIVVRTAVDGVGADCGRAAVRDDVDAPLEERARAGVASGHEGALGAAERTALSRGLPVDVRADGHAALAFPLRPTERPDRILGIVSVAREGGDFTKGERDLFNYLAGQAAVSIENVDLHELVQRQAVTDELTGLFNHRRFQEVIEAEVERAERFDQPLGLLMLDIDDFKKINDTYGHQQGDMVLREVARVLRENARQVDEPARYGGEEMAVALPQTDLEGTYLLAERVRESIAALNVHLLEGGGTLQVTASFGVAAFPESARAKDRLIAAADSALYRAKRAGKNRTVRAEAAPPPAVPG